eukprot:Phypoly_transcript_20677.p2 GENE.Phypoly_transcript_20677~~Phypoly_transcript_20677.p2  ORF type:complete len:168 (+),score=37.05 Phypoly_transcript_20677:65-568(+)
MDNVSLSKEDVDRLFADFRKADADSSGALDYAEFCKVIGDRVFVADQLPKIFKSFDKNGDGKIDSNEFLTALAVALNGTLPQKLEALFNVYDTNGNNILSPDELEALVNHVKSASAKIFVRNSDELTTGFAQSIIKQLDTNKDGQITREEWIKARIPALVNLLGVSE